MADYDAIIVGAGHNGLAAAMVLGRAGWKVLVLETSDVPGGASKSRELTLPGYIHDMHAANIGFFLGSDTFADFKDEMFANGFNIACGDQPFASTFPDGDAVCGYTDHEKMMAELARHDPADAQAWADLLQEFSKLSGPILQVLKMPMPSTSLLRQMYKVYRTLGASDFWDMAQILLSSSRSFTDSRFKSEKVKALFTPWGFHLDQAPDIAGGAMFPYLEVPLDCVNGLAFSAGGIGRMMDSMVAIVKRQGGDVRMNSSVTSIPVDKGRAVGVVLQDGTRLSAKKAVIASVTPPKLFGSLVAESDVPIGFMKKVHGFRYSAGATLMIHLALDGPVPWTAPECGRAGTVHLGATLEEIVASEHAAAHGQIAERPYVIVAQQSLFDPTRAPDGAHTLWGYCHVPNGSTVDMTERIEAQIERFAPGFRDRIIGRSTLTPADFHASNANFIGGDINAGAQDIRQIFTRPVPRYDPYSTPNPRLYICSASTPPGGGVHGMGGYHAARSALRRAW